MQKLAIGIFCFFTSVVWGSDAWINTDPTSRGMLSAGITIPGNLSLLGPCPELVNDDIGASFALGHAQTSDGQLVESISIHALRNCLSFRFLTYSNDPRVFELSRLNTSFAIPIMNLSGDTNFLVGSGISFPINSTSEKIAFLPGIMSWFSVKGHRPVFTSASYESPANLLRLAASMPFLEEFKLWISVVGQISQAGKSARLGVQYQLGENGTCCFLRAGIGYVDGVAGSLGLGVLLEPFGLDYALSYEAGTLNHILAMRFEI